MYIFFWNYRDAGSRNFAAQIKTVMGGQNPKIIAPMETRTDCNKASRVFESLSFDSWETIEGEGFSGGIWLVWHCNKVAVNVTKRNFQYMYLEIQPNYRGRWFCTFVYSNPQPALKIAPWRELENISKDVVDP